MTQRQDLARRALATLQAAAESRRRSLTATGLTAAVDGAGGVTLRVGDVIDPQAEALATLALLVVQIIDELEATIPRMK